METLHDHNGVNSKQIDPRNLRGFPILTATPTGKAREGTIVLAYISATCYLYAFINGAWVKTTLS